jgi:hypothetical protein
MQKSLFTLLLAAIPLIAAERVVAQAPGDGQKKELKEQGSGPGATQNSVSEQAGKAEPGAKAKTSEVENVFVNGVLTVLAHSIRDGETGWALA